MAYQVAFQAQVLPMVFEIMDTIGQYTGGRVHYQIAPDNTEYPVFIYQSQDGGGVNDDTIGHNGWNGLLTLRCAHTSLSGVFNLLTHAMNMLCVPSGFNVTSPLLSGTFNARFVGDHIIPLPTETLTEGTIYQAGIIFTVYMKPNTE